MEQIHVTVPHITSHYPIIIGERCVDGALSQFVTDGTSKMFCIVDDLVYQCHKQLIDETFPHATLYLMHAIEANKSIAEVQRIWSAMHIARLDRKSLVMNIGGGITGDLGGFAASAYMRGLDFVQIPTSLLSMVDASVGGKVGVNFDKVKNLLGSFQQPKAIVVDTQFLRSLPIAQIRSGLAEMLKHGLIYDRNHWNHCIAIGSSLDKRKGQIPLSIIQESIEVKRFVIEQDPTEQGIRKILNFGHTVGHAIESISHSSQKPLLHGEAVAIGMVAESYIAEKLGMANNLLTILKTGIESCGLPISYHIQDIGQCISIMKSDKKNRGGSIRMSLIDRIGSCKWDIEVSDEIVRESLCAINSLL